MTSKSPADLSDDSDEETLINRTVLRRKLAATTGKHTQSKKPSVEPGRQYTLESASSSGGGPEPRRAEISSGAGADYVDVFLNTALVDDASQEPAWRRVSEALLILFVLVVAAYQEPLVWEHENAILFAKWAATCGTILLIRYRYWSFPQTLYEIVFPPILALTCNSSQATLRLNLLISAAGLPIQDSLKGALIALNAGGGVASSSVQAASLRPWLAQGLIFSPALIGALLKGLIPMPVDAPVYMDAVADALVGAEAVAGAAAGAQAVAKAVGSMHAGDTRTAREGSVAVTGLPAAIASASRCAAFSSDLPGEKRLFEDPLSILSLHQCLADFLLYFSGKSLTHTEISLFASLLANVIMYEPAADSHAIVGVYCRGILLCVFGSLLLAMPWIESYVRLSFILGSKNRLDIGLQKAHNVKVAYAVAFSALGLLSSIVFPLEKLKFIMLYIFTPLHLKMLGYWLAVLSILLPVVILNAHKWQLDLRRKVWHGCVVVMFLLGGANIDAEFTCLSMTVALALFVTVEVVRATNFPPFGTALHKTLIEFTDSRDTCGPIIVSYQFLLLGISLPLLFAYSPAGIICLGLGDAAASIIGRRFGRHKWFGTSKSWEGTIAFVCGVYGGLHAAGNIGYPAKSRQAKLLISCSTALLEATSGMNDNVIVPLFMLVISELL